MGRKAPTKTVRIVVPPEKSDNTENTEKSRNKAVGTLSPAGRGLGKAGARRLGRLLKRAIQSQGESSVKGAVCVPKTPVRLFKHRILNTRANGPQIETPKTASPQISKLILSLVSQCRHKGGMSMTELKQTLATEGYDVTKNKQVTVVTKRLLNNEKLVQTKTNSIILNTKQSDNQKRKVQARNKIKEKTATLPTTQASVTHPKPTATKSRATRDSTKEEKSQIQSGKTRKISKSENKSNLSTNAKPKAKTQKRKYKPRGKTVKARKKQKHATKKCKPVPTVKKATKRTQKNKKLSKAPKRNSNETTKHKQRSQKKQPAKKRKNTLRRTRYCKLTGKRSYYY